MAGIDKKRDGYSVEEILSGLNDMDSADGGSYSLESILEEFGSGAKTPAPSPMPTPQPRKPERPAESEQPKEKPSVEKWEKPEKKPTEKPKKPVEKPKKPAEKTEKKPAEKPKKSKEKREKPLAQKHEEEGFGTHFGPKVAKPIAPQKQARPNRKFTSRRSGPNISPQEYVSKRKGATRLRGVSAAMLFLIGLALCYVCFAPTFHIPIPAQITFTGGVELHHFIVLGLSAIAMVIGFPVIFAGVYELLKLRPGLFTAVTFTQFANLMHILYNQIFPSAVLQKPYAPVAVFTLFFAVLGQWKKECAYLRSAKTAGMSKEPLGIHSNEWYNQFNIIKQPVRDPNSFARRLEGEDYAEQTWHVFAPLGMAAALIFAVMTAIVSRDLGRFFWTLAAVSCAVTPFVGAFGFAEPFAILSRRLSHVGSSLAGWYAAELLSGRQKLIVRDSDLFPKGAVTFNGIRMLGSFSLAQALSYATSIFKESNNGLYSVFYEELKSQFGRLVNVRNMRHYDYGGVEAELEGNLVYVGTASFMTRMGVHLGEEKDAKNVVFVAINGAAAALFQMKYRANIEIQDALLDVIDAKIKPVLAVVDFNLTSEMVERVFELEADAVEFPGVEERLDLATESRHLDFDPCAFVTRAGFVPFASCVLAAKRLRRVTKRNVLLTVLCVFFGFVLMSFLTWIGNIYASAPYHMFWFQLLWMVPVLIHSQRVK